MTEVAGTTVEIELQEGMRFTAMGSDGVAAALDSSPEHGGNNAGLRPMELMLASLGGCTAMDVLSILRKKRQDVTAYMIEVSGVQTDQPPRVFTEISIRHIVEGNVSEDALKHAIELSETKYCPAYAMLSKAASISTTFEVHRQG
jgi:putative redox protein